MVKVLSIACSFKLSGVVSEFALLCQVDIVLQEMKFVLVTVTKDRVLIYQEAIISGFDVISQPLSHVVLNAVFGRLVKLRKWVPDLLGNF